MNRGGRSRLQLGCNEKLAGNLHGMRTDKTVEGIVKDLQVRMPSGKQRQQNTVNR